MKANALALAAGCLLTLSLAPLSIWPAGLLSLTLLLWLLRTCDSKRTFWLGWLFGLGLFGSGASWVYVSINQFGNASPLLAGFLTALWCMGLALLPGLTCALWQNLRQRFKREDGKPGFASEILLFPALWVLGEWLRTWLLTGFPWLFAGYAQVDGPLQAWGPINGVLGISLILALSAAWLVQLRSAKLVQNLALGALLLFCWTLGLWQPALDWTEKTDKALSVGLVQANIDQNEKWRPEKIAGHINLQRQMTEPLWGLDLIIWPEAAIPALYHNAEPILASIARQAEASGTAFVSGIPYQDRENEQVHNAIVRLAEDRQLYFKRNLVPFGEFMPLEGLLRGIIDFFDLPMSSFSAGPEQQDYLQLGNFSASALICYEAVYLDTVPAGNPAPPDLLLTISNDTWFGTSFGPLQHLQMARMRALEWGRSMARGTNNGVSALIGPDGSILQQSAQFARESLVGDLAIRQGVTPYARFGSLPVIGLCAAMILFAGLSGWSQRRR